MLTLTDLFCGTGGSAALSWSDAAATEMPWSAAAPALTVSRHARGGWPHTKWAVVHTRSHLPVIGGLGFGPAHEAGRLLMQSGVDWTRPAHELRVDEPARSAIGRVRHELDTAAQAGRRVWLRESSWRLCPPPWLAIALDDQEEFLDGYISETYADAEEMAIELADELHHAAAIQPRPLASWDVTVSRSDEPYWELQCARRGCRVVLNDDDYDGPFRYPDRALLTENATDSGWHELDQRRWLCPHCTDVFLPAGRD